MSAILSPNLVDSGLVMCFDAANLRSFRGEPTKNWVQAITWGGDGGSSVVESTNVQYNRNTTYLFTLGTSNNCYLNGGDLSSEASTVWTFSCYVRREDGGVITGTNVYMYYPSSDGSGAATITSVGNGWYRLSRTRTGTSNLLPLVGFTTLVSGIKYYLSCPQVEKMSYPTNFVAINTTRGTTVATGGGCIDLSGNGNNGELVNGPTFSPDNVGSIVFAGDDDHLVFPDITIASDMSFELWIKATEFTAATATSLICKRSVSTDGYFIFTLDSSDELYFDFGGNSHRWNTAYVPPTNTWVHLVLTKDSTYRKLYVNGDYNTQTNDAGVVAQASSSIYVGKDALSSGYYYKGKIASILIYNKTLTATEVKQNYRALKGRFGL